MHFVLGIFTLELYYVNPHVYKHIRICIKRVLLILFDLCLLSKRGLEVRVNISDTDKDNNKKTNNNKK